VARIVGCAALAVVLLLTAGACRSKREARVYGSDGEFVSRVEDDGMDGIEEAITILVGAGAGLILGFISLVMTFMAVLLYVVARWRAMREGGLPDPHLGVKTALSFFRVLAAQVALAGLFLFLYAMMTKQGDETRKDIFRTAGGLLVPSVLIYAAHVGLAYVTNARQLPIVSRLFAGLNMLVVGLVGFASLVAAFVLLFQKDSPTEANRLVWSLVVVYVSAWIVQAVLLLRKSGLLLGAQSPPGLAAAPPAAGPPAPAPPKPTPPSTPPTAPTA
jgi:hypothetical protein